MDKHDIKSQRRDGELGRNPIIIKRWLPSSKQESPAGTNLFSLDMSPLGGGYSLPPQHEPIRVEQPDEKPSTGFRDQFEVP